MYGSFVDGGRLGVDSCMLGHGHGHGFGSSLPPSPVLICRCGSRWVMQVYVDVQDVCFLVCVDVEDDRPVLKRAVDAGIGDRGSRIRTKDAGSGMA